MADAEDPSKKYDQAFFLNLAEKGKDAWNTWRRDPANEKLRVTFAGIDFSEAPRDEIDFSGFEFGNSADFTRCSWRGAEHEKISEVFLSGLDPTFHKPGRASFAGTAFGHSANFAGSTFGTNATFTRAAFGWRAIFTGVAFGSGASFANATFGPQANFTRAAFGHRTYFVGAIFSDDTLFTGAVFGDQAYFDQTHFMGTVKFSGYSEEQWTRHVEAYLRRTPEEKLMAVIQRNKESWARLGCGPDRFLRISFANAHFDGEAIFSGRSFERTADFTNARFYYPPDFDGVTNASRIDFTGAHIGFARPGKRPWTKYWTKDSRVPLRLRAVRKIAEDTKNHDLERDLYIEERKAERGVYFVQQLEALKKDSWKNWPRNAGQLIAHFLWIIVMGVYWALADYGRSFIRPAIWLFVSNIFFYWRYEWLFEPLKQKAGPANAAEYERALKIVQGNYFVPSLGPLPIDAEIKKFLFCPGFDPCVPIPPDGYQPLMLIQTGITITCLFFIGLALRNYFKIK